MESPIIIPVVIVAAIILIFLIWRNNKDKSDINTELTDELAKKKHEGEVIK